MAGYAHLEVVRDFEKYVKDKKTSALYYYRYLLTRCLRMFQYNNLPDTIPHEVLDRYLFENGIACITKVNDSLRVFYGNLGGPQDIYYRPTEFIVANPHVKVNGEIFSANIKIFPTDDDPSGSNHTQEGILIRNDTDWIGLHPLISRYAYLLSENTLTLRTADVMLRIIALLTAKTDAERKSALEYLKSIEKGELGVIGESTFHEGVEMQSPPSNNGSYLTQFIEYQQYLKGSFYNEIGLSANYNMKREAIGKGESTLDEDALLPLCDNMLKTRQEDIQKVNELYGTDISVEFSSSWLTNRIEALQLLSTSSSGANHSAGFVDSSGSELQNDESDLGEVEPNKDEDDANEEEVEPNKEEVESSKDEGDSSINDISEDVEYTKLLDNVVEEIENPTEVVQTTEMFGGDDNENNETSTEDKENISDN